MRYFVSGGHYSDFTFTSIENPIEFGPFDSYQAAYVVWKQNMWLNVDDGQYRLTISENPIDPQLTVEVSEDGNTRTYRHGNRPGRLISFRKNGDYWISFSDPSQQKIPGGAPLHQAVIDWCGDTNIHFFDKVKRFRLGSGNLVDS